MLLICWKAASEQPMKNMQMLDFGGEMNYNLVRSWGGSPHSAFNNSTGCERPDADSKVPFRLGMGDG